MEGGGYKGVGKMCGYEGMGKEGEKRGWGRRVEGGYKDRSMRHGQLQ